MAIDGRLLNRLNKEDKLVRNIVAEAARRIDTDVMIKPAEFRQRWKKVQKAIKKEGFDCAYMTGSELDRSDVAWLAGVYYPQIERYGAFIATSGVPVVVAGSEGGHVVEEHVEYSGAKMAVFRAFQLSDEEYLGVEWKDMNYVKKLLRLKKVKKVALLSPPDVTPYSQIEMLQKEFGKKNVSFVPEILQHIKYEKSPKELEIKKHANIIADAALRGMLAVLQPGVTELQVASVGDRIMKYLGASRLGFVTIVTSGERNYTLIANASNKKIRRGEMVAMGLSPTFNGYHGICRRTVKVGKKPYNRDQKALLEAVEGLYCTVMDAAIEAVKCGRPTNWVDQRGRDYLNAITFNTMLGKKVAASELPPYTFIHNTGCSECQEGYGAVTPYTGEKFGKSVALMIDVALKGFHEAHKPLFKDMLYAVVEDTFWIARGKVGVYNRMPINVQHLVGNGKPIKKANPYYKEYR